MKTLSWILLAIVAVLLALGGVASTTIAYFAGPSSDVITGSVSLQDLSIDDQAAAALRGRRGTAAAFALAFATILLFVILGPYRRGEVWAWWAILCSVVVLAAVIGLRLISPGISQGTATGWMILGAVAVALLLDLRRVAGKP